MDSQDMTITYKAIQERARQDAMEYMPKFPKVSTVDAWEEYIANLEDLDAMEIAHESAEWDWVIYYGRAMELCQAVPNEVLNDAEQMVDEMGWPHGENFGLYELACAIAYWIVVQEVADAVEECRDELLELANDKLEQMESE